VVLGHAGYYPIFGFSPVSEHGLTCQWECVPDDSFMVSFPQKDYEGVVRGTVQYMKEFSESL
jgi:predicted N-acetyltransferase YhbS